MVFSFSSFFPVLLLSLLLPSKRRSCPRAQSPFLTLGCVGGLSGILLLCFRTSFILSSSFFSRSPLRTRRGRAAVGRVRAATPISSLSPPRGGGGGWGVVFSVSSTPLFSSPDSFRQRGKPFFKIIENVKRDCRRRAHLQSWLFSLWVGMWSSPSLLSSPSFFSPSSFFPNATRAPARNPHS